MAFLLEVAFGASGDILAAVASFERCMKVLLVLLAHS